MVAGVELRSALRYLLQYIYLNPLSAVLHIDPVILVIPQHLYALVLIPVQGVCLSSRGLYEEILTHVSFPHQY